MYFEIEDIKHRYTPYHTTYNVHGWIDTPEMSFSWDWFRGAVVGSIAMCANNYFCNLKDKYELLRTKYNPPESIKQAGLYYKTIKQLDCYKPSLRSYLFNGLAVGSIDVGLRLAIFRYFTGGIYQTEGTVNVDYYRRPFPTMLAAALSSWVCVPFEVSRAAYKADLTFPEHLRYGYTSPLNAFWKMLTTQPFALFKNGSPSMAASFVQTSFMFAIFDYTFDLYSLLFREFGVPISMVKIFITYSAASLACMAGYPFHVTIRQMVELYPKQISEGVFHNNYRKAFWYLWNTENGAQPWVGFKKYYMRNITWMYLTLYLAEWAGFFKAWRTSYIDWPGVNDTKTFM